MLKPGDKMPEFKVEDQEGNIVESSSLIGKKTIIYWDTCKLPWHNVT